MANESSHLTVFFARSLRVRKEHIAGQQAAEGKTDLMEIISAGTSKRIRRDVAMDLMTAESVIHETSINADRIKIERQRIAEEAKQDEPKLKKAA